ncbi:hypothetical protein Tsp_08435 [Trichinella spiralis]|uniref:hypothetical protein n=1 Tax=Trichinella spiralis TaxID=6334 RepID=UPI0001EFB58A|nr:hypothetical protein Tsp_08435 [Trichinella spiralis]
MHTHTRNVCRLPRQAAFKPWESINITKCTLVVKSFLHLFIHYHPDHTSTDMLISTINSTTIILRLNLFLQLNVQHIECQLENLLWYVVCVCHMWNANCIQIVCDSFGATNTNTTNNNNSRRRVYI